MLGSFPTKSVITSIFFPLFSPSEQLLLSGQHKKTAVRKALLYLLTATFCEISTAARDGLYTRRGPGGDLVDGAGEAAEGYQCAARWTNVGTSKLRRMAFNPRREPANINPCEEEQDRDCVSATLNVITVNQPPFIGEGCEQ